MLLPTSVVVLESQYVQRFAVPEIAQGESQDAFEARCRQWTARFAETVAFRFPNQGWGLKRSGAGHPIGKDTLAQQLPNQVLRVWDLLIGAGTGHPSLAVNVQSQDVPGQVFQDVVARNWLEDVPPIDPPPPPDKPYAAIVAQLEHLEALLKQHEDAELARYAQVMRAIVAAPSYQAEIDLPIFGKRKITLTPIR